MNLSESRHVLTNTWRNVLISPSRIVDSNDDIQITGKEDVSNDVVLRSKPVREPLNSDQCANLFDEDGRLVKECKLRQALFEG